MAGPEGNFPSGYILNLGPIKEKQLIAGGYAVSLDPVEMIEEKEIEIEVEEPKIMKKTVATKPKPKKKKAVSK